MATLEDDHQPAASYKLPIGVASVDILADIDVRVSSTSPGMRSHEVSKLLQYQGVCSRKFYRFQGEEITKVKALNRHVTVLAGLRTFDNLNKTNVIWSSNEAEDLEAALQSIVDGLVDFAMKSLGLKSIDDARLVYWLSLAGARCQLLVTKMALTLWANVILKCRDAVLTKVKYAVSFESFMDLRNSTISMGEELFLTDVLDKAIEKSSKVLHAEAIKKAVTRDKPSTSGKKLPFSTTPRKQQVPQPRNPQGCHRGHLSVRLPPSRCPSRLLLFPPTKRRGRNFEDMSSSSQPQVGGLLSRH